MNEIDCRERLRLREEKGWESGKTNATWKGKPMKILKKNPMTDDNSFYVILEMNLRITPGE